MTARQRAHEGDAHAEAKPAPRAWMRRMRHPETGEKVISPRRANDGTERMVPLEWEHVRSLMRGISLPEVGNAKQRNELKRKRKARRV